MVRAMKTSLEQVVAGLDHGTIEIGQRTRSCSINKVLALRVHNSSVIWAAAGLDLVKSPKDREVVEELVEATP